VAACRRLGLPFSADPSSYRLLREYGPERFLADVDGAAVLFPNRDEARELTGRADPAEGAAELARRFPVVAVKLGPDGCLVAARGALRAVPAGRPDGLAIDPTGAGDAFAAGFLAGLLGVGLSGAGEAADTQAAASGAADPQAAAQAAVRLAARAVRVIGGRGRG
jgi:sugar/nucleoside kinase (ribokinase family)